jgi:hypothetical protein
MADPILLSEISSPDKASRLFQSRRSSHALAADKFYQGDHFQNFDGWIGAKPPHGSPGYKDTVLQIERGFVSENVIKEVIDRHGSGVLGREPLWGFLPSDVPAPSTEQRRKVFSKLFKLVRTTIRRVTGDEQDRLVQEADDALTIWWNNRKPRNTLKEALRTALIEGRSVLRFFFPAGLRDENGQIVQPRDLSSAVNIPHLELLTCDKAGIFTDSRTLQEFGLYLYQRSDNKRVVELTFVQNGLTILQILVDGEAVQIFTFELGGRLLMNELNRAALISPQVMSNQRALNLALTMMMRNVNLAGSLERTILNAEPPKKVTKVRDPNTPGGYRDELAETNKYWEGPGATVALAGLLIRNDKGEIIGRANPNISFRDPVPIDTFTGTRDQFYASILGQCQQRHALISGDATASGKSRSQARGEYRGSLWQSKDPVDDTGRWLLETELRLAAQLCGRTREFLQLRADFNAIVEDGPVDAGDRQENRADVQAGLMSKETAMSRNGIEDTDAEIERISQEPQPTIDLTKQPQGQQLAA